MGGLRRGMRIISCAWASEYPPHGALGVWPGLYPASAGECRQGGKNGKGYNFDGGVFRPKSPLKIFQPERFKKFSAHMEVARRRNGTSGHQGSSQIKP